MALRERLKPSRYDGDGSSRRLKPSRYTDWVIALLLLATLASDPAESVVRCSVTGDPHARVYALERIRVSDGVRWRLAMRSRESGAAPVVLPLPDAKPSLSATAMTLDYRTLNGGREVRWTVAPAGATLHVYANFELEVNVETDLDPRVELMNTDGTIAALSCAITPNP